MRAFLLYPETRGALIPNQETTMTSYWQETLWQQFGATLDMLENAIRMCPETVWGDSAGFHEFWYMAYHTLFWTDYYLSESPDGFAPPAPYTLSEFDPEGAFPDRVYSRDEMLAYLAHCRAKARSTFAHMTEKRAGSPSPFRTNLTVAELHLYNMRHVQHHAAQLNLLLRQRIDSAPRWVSRAGQSLDLD
jgi:hypothetical protein